jgi:hypothetical protein
MKSRIPLPSEAKKHLQKQADEHIAEYFRGAQTIISERLCLATILVLDDCFRDLFGSTDEEILQNYRRFAACLGNMFIDYKRDCYDWGHSDDPEAIAKEMRAELLERGIEVNFR